MKYNLYWFMTGFLISASLYTITGKANPNLDINSRQFCWYELNQDYVCQDMATGKKTTVSRRI